MIVYSVIPIEYWDGWLPPRELINGARRNPQLRDEHHHTRESWARLWLEAADLARECGWQGDIADGPYVTVLPEDPGEYRAPPLVIGWSQKLNRASFIASPFDLPWVRKRAAKWARTKPPEPPGKAPAPAAPEASPPPAAPVFELTRP